MTGRKVKEWIGATADTPVPPRVRLRVFEAFDGKCGITGRKIQAGDAWDVDHIRALANGGENRESNLQPALKEAHKAKTARDVAQKSKDRRVRSKHLGIHKSKTPLPGGRGSKFKRKRRWNAGDKSQGRHLARIWVKLKNHAMESAMYR